MREQEFANELTQVADSFAVPTDLFPAGRLTEERVRRGWGRWPLVASVAVLAVLAFLLSPVGQRTARATLQYFMHFTYRVATPQEVAEAEERARLNPPIRPEDREVERVEHIPYQELPNGRGYIPPQTIQVVTVARMAELYPTWPLPTYLGPAPEDRVTINERFDRTGEKRQAVSISLIYQVEFEGELREVAYDLTRSDRGISDAEIKMMTEEPAVAVRDGSGLRSERVTLNGMEATALGGESGWMVRWVHHGGYGSVGAALPLEEIRKIAESLPDLR